MDERAHDLRFLFETSRRLNQALQWPRLLEEIRDLSCEAFDAEGCSLLLWNEDRTRLEFQLAYNQILPSAERPALLPGEGLAGWISEFREPTVVHDVASDPRYRHVIDRAVGFHTRNVLGAPIFRGTAVIGVLEIHNKQGGGDFTAEDVRLAEALCDVMAVALMNALLVLSLKREKAENEALYRISLLLNEKLDPGQLLETFLDAVASVVPYQAASIYLLHSDAGELEWYTHRGYPADAAVQIRLKLGEGIVGWVAKSGQAQVIADVALEPRYREARKQTRSEVVVPIIAESRLIGVFNLESDRVDAFRSADLRVLQAFANQAGISLQRAQFYREMTEMHRLESELGIARKIQRLFLPEDPADLPGYDLAGMNVASREVSGDFYDYIEITSGQLGIMIGDVSGKGAPAALITATLRASLRAEIRNRYSIAEILAKVNHLLWESTEPERFATAVYGVLDCGRRVFTYANAGHNPPLHFDSGGGVQPLALGGLILGPFPDSRYEQGLVTLAPGDILAFYTDGLPEAVDQTGADFGRERLERAIWDNRHHTAKQICQRVLQEVRNYAGGKHAADDLTLVILRVL